MPVATPTFEEEQQYYNKSFVRRGVEMFLQKLALRISILGVADNGSGLIRITTNGAHGLSDNDQVFIDGVLGTTEANGFWKVTNISSNTLDLQSSAYSNAWTGNGGVYDGISWSIQMAASSSSILVNTCIKTIDGSNVAPSSSAKKITSTTETEIASSGATYDRAIHSITVQNNDASSKSGNLRLRNTKSGGSINEIIVPFTLAAGYKLLVGVDGVQWLYQDNGKPYVS